VKAEHLRPHAVLLQLPLRQASQRAVCCVQEVSPDDHERNGGAGYILTPSGEQGWLVRGMAEGEDPSKALNG
jgi:hypothetical protein